MDPSATWPAKNVKAYNDALFAMSFLVGGTMILYGMLSIQRGPFQQRKEYMTKIWGHPIPERDGSSPRMRFLKAFCGRPTFIQGVVFAILFVYWHKDWLKSITISLLVAGYLLSIVRSLETKFIPSAVIICCILYAVLHILGVMNGWHDGQKPIVMQPA